MWGKLTKTDDILRKYFVTSCPVTKLLYMITNREEVLENALRVFAKMNYEKASQTEIAKACGLSKAGLIYYYPLKLDLFIAVIDKYVFHMQSTSIKFNFQSCTLHEFIEQYISGVERTMSRLIQILDDGNNPSGCSFNFYYFIYSCK